MNGQYHRWTMAKDHAGVWHEKDFITQEATADMWRFTDSTQPRATPVVWRTGMELEMRPGERDEIVGHPTRIQILGFKVETVGVRGGIGMRARVLEASPLSRGVYDVGSVHTFDSELARGAYRIPVRVAAYEA